MKKNQRTITQKPNVPRVAARESELSRWRLTCHKEERANRSLYIKITQMVLTFYQKNNSFGFGQLSLTILFLIMIGGIRRKLSLYNVIYIYIYISSS